MRIQTLFPALAVLALAQPAQADLAQFEFAFTEVCLKNLPDLSGAEKGFAAGEWQIAKGADPGEFELGLGSTMVFLKAVAAIDGPACTVMDETMPMLAAEWLLELALAKHAPGQWEKSTGYGDQAVWLLKNDGFTTEFYINEGLGGGAAISLQVQQ